MAELIPRGDGSFILKPKLFDRDLDTWISIRDTARIIGHVKTRHVYGLLGEYLVYCRPLPRKTVVSLKSALALKRATRDAAFWESPSLRQKVKDQVARAMQELAWPPTQSVRDCVPDGVGTAAARIFKPPSKSSSGDCRTRAR